MPPPRHTHTISQLHLGFILYSTWNLVCRSHLNFCLSQCGIWRFQQIRPGVMHSWADCAWQLQRVWDPIHPGFRRRRLVWGLLKIVPFHSLICMLGIYWKLLWWSISPEVSAESSQQSYQSPSVVGGLKAPEPEEAAPLFTCDSLMAMCGPSWEEEEISVAGVTLSWRILPQQDALKWPQENLKTQAYQCYVASAQLTRPSQPSVF